MRYWDSCAIVPLCTTLDIFAEQTKTIALEDDIIVTWWGSQVECCSTFARLRRAGRQTPEEESMCRARLGRLAGAWNEVEPSERLRTLAKQLLLRQNLRAADAFQLAAAIIWAQGEPEGSGFVTYDKNLRLAAQSEGFTIYPAHSEFEQLIANL